MTTEQHISPARRRLEDLRRAQLRLDLSGGIGYAVAVILIVWLTAIIIEQLWQLPPVIKVPLCAGGVLLSVLAVGIAIWGIRNKNYLRSGVAAEDWWAMRLGSSAPDTLRDRLLNAIQLSRSSPRDRDRYSPDLARHALYKVVSEMKDIPDTPALSPEKKKNGVRTLAITFVVLLCVVLISPNSFLSATSRLVNANTAYRTAAAFSLSVNPTTGWVYRGEAVTFKITAQGDAPREADFFFQYPGGELQRERISLVNGVGEFQIASLTNPVDYSAGWKQVSSPPYHLYIVTRPQIADLQYRLHPPKYSRLSTEIGQDNVGDLEALPGSRMELTVRATKPLQNAWFVFFPQDADSSEIDSVLMDISSHTGSVQQDIFRQGRYHIRLQDEQGHWDMDPVSYRISLLFDEYPTARIVFPDADVEIGEQMILPVEVEADDDFGISRMNLAYRKLSGDTAVSSFRLPLHQSGIQTVSIEHTWSLAELDLMPGDVLEYWVLAWDNDAVNGPKRGESERRLVRLPSLEEIVARVEGTEEESIGQAEVALEEARELREEVAEIVEQLRRNPETNWEQQQQIESAMERQQELEKQVEELAQRLDELVEGMEKHDMASDETMQKYKQLQELIAEISTPELKEAMEKLRKAMESQDPDEVREAMEMFDIDREQFLQNIERSLEILKQLQLERRLDELTKQVEELLHRQEQILSQIDSTDIEPLAPKQEALAQSTEQFEDRLGEMRQLAAESGEDELASALDSLAKTLSQKELPATMRDAASQMAQNNPSGSKQKGEQSARDLAELLNSLITASSEFKEQKKAEIAQKMRRIVEELLLLSREQEDLAQRSDRLGSHSPQYRSLAGSQEDIRRALMGVTERMFDLSKETFFVTPDLGATLGKASESMDKALEGYTSRNPRSVASPQVEGMGELNKAARQMIDILGQLEGSGSSTGYEEMMEKLSQMASQQQGLNNQSMPMPGMEGQQQMPGNQQLARMAAQQRALQQQMEQMGEDAQGMQEILGDLEGIAKSMGDVAKDFEDKNIDERTRRLQRQIVSRLLDATRSVRQQEYSKKRESRTGDKIVRHSPPELQLNNDRNRLRRDLMRALQEGYTRDYRRLIRAYFQSLEAKLEKKQ